MSLRSVIKAFVPAGVIRQFRAHQRASILRSFPRDWDMAIALARPHERAHPVARLLIIPCDQYTLVGSLGDEAMITACVQAARQANPGVAIHVVTASPQASEEARKRGLVPEEIWARRDYLKQFAGLLNRTGFDVATVVGADVLDGHYDPLTAMKMLASCDIAARAGVGATTLGFSFNDHPHESLRAVLGRLDPRVRLHARDALSLERLRRFANVDASLVADSAFGLAPAEPPRAVVEWIAAQRQAGRRIIGINIHPLLIKNITVRQIEDIIERSCQAVRMAGDRHPAAFLLLPHDYRGELGDLRCLGPIFERVSPDLGDRVMLLGGTHSAAVLKGVCGLLDGLATGRMHLAIAALGCGVPAMSVTYQDKFEGLYQHFGLPRDLLLSPDEILAGDALGERLSSFIADLDRHTATVEAALPSVLALSRENFAAFA